MIASSRLFERVERNGIAPYGTLAFFNGCRRFNFSFIILTASAVVILSAEHDSRLGEGDLGEDALKVGDGKAVVGDGHALLSCFGDA